MKIIFIVIILLLYHCTSFSAVILQYHNVSDDTPKNTSITPAQFTIHMEYLHTHNFNVVPLSQVINNIKNQTPLKDKTVVITFDDAYSNIFTHAKPILDQFNYPYTIYVNPDLIPDNDSTANAENPSPFLSWAQLKSLADKGVIIANHGFEHHSMIRIPNGLTKKQWLAKQTTLLLKAEEIIKDKIGKSWRYFAYPYGEYSPSIQNWVKKNNFIAFSQQSGAIGLHTDLTSVPRFPVSMPYDKIDGLRDKLNSLPFTIQLHNEQAETIFKYKQTSSITFNIDVDDFYKAGLNCYISGLGKQTIQWQGENQFTINFSDDLPIGRVRCNCTAASISKPGRHYWYSKPWYVLKENGEWYHL